MPGLQYSVQIGSVNQRKMPGAAPVGQVLCWSLLTVFYGGAILSVGSLLCACRQAFTNSAWRSLTYLTMLRRCRRGEVSGRGAVSGLGCVEQGENQAAGVCYRVGVEFRGHRVRTVKAAM